MDLFFATFLRTRYEGWLGWGKAEKSEFGLEEVALVGGTHGTLNSGCSHVDREEWTELRHERTNERDLVSDIGMGG